MPAKGFICTRTKKNISFHNCITKCDKRCISRRTAMIYRGFSKKERDGKSITQLITPTRQQYLMQTQNTFESPSSYVDRTIGSLGHELADIKCDLKKYGGVSEETFYMTINDETLHGTPDSYENNEIWDLKITGGYKVKMGLKDIRNLHDWILQQNFYRLLIEDHYERKIHSIHIEVWAKEPASTLRRLKVPKVHVFDLPKLSDWLVIKYVKIKRERLKKALMDRWYTKCKYKYLWKGRRCDYCAVREMCEAMDKKGEGNDKQEKDVSTTKVHTATQPLLPNM